MSEHEHERAGVGERMGAFFREHSIMTNSKVNRHLSLNLPDMIEEHNLSVRTDLKEVDDLIGPAETKIDSLEKWKTSTQERLDRSKDRVELLEKKYGL
jgi:hypothetical protein